MSAFKLTVYMVVGMFGAAIFIVTIMAMGVSIIQLASIAIGNPAASFVGGGRIPTVLLFAIPFLGFLVLLLIVSIGKKTLAWVLQ